MPGVVKNQEDERLWQKAKDLAEEAGHKENYAYIMGIFKKMNPERFSFMNNKKLAFDIHRLAISVIGSDTSSKEKLDDLSDKIQTILGNEISPAYIKIRKLVREMERVSDPKYQDVIKYINDSVEKAYDAAKSIGYTALGDLFDEMDT